MIMNEIWKDLIGYDNRYEVSNTGKVRIKGNKKVLKQYEHRGYKYVGLYFENKTHNMRVHRLIAKTFLKDFTQNCVVMHLDNNTRNNNVNNLKCGTQRENIQQCCEENRRFYSNKKINQYDLDNNFIKQWDNQTQIKNELGYGQNMISMCCNGVRKRGYGYIWRYASK